MDALWRLSLDTSVRDPLATNRVTFTTTAISFEPVVDLSP